MKSIIIIKGFLILYYKMSILPLLSFLALVLLFFSKPSCYHSEQSYKRLRHFYTAACQVSSVFSSQFSDHFRLMHQIVLHLDHQSEICCWILILIKVYRDIKSPKLFYLKYYFDFTLFLLPKGYCTSRFKSLNS